MNDRQTHVGKMEHQLAQWGEQLDELKAKATKVGGDVKADYHKHIDDLKAKHEVARSKLEELRTASGEKWDTVKAGAESVWNELEAAFKKLTA